ncbi:MAG: hypothetical protein LBP59_15555 [Planctomycetaceae bacterium]|nr:hypothetical protein [Planctomycetaceae bacterium]
MRLLTAGHRPAVMKVTPLSGRIFLATIHQKQNNHSCYAPYAETRQNIVTILGLNLSACVT